MEKNLELISKLKLGEETIREIIKEGKFEGVFTQNNKIKAILILENKDIIITYERRFEIYKPTLEKYLEICPFYNIMGPNTIENIYEIESKKNYIYIAIYQSINTIFFFEIKNKSFEHVQSIIGDIVCKLSSNKILNILVAYDNNSIAYSIYKKGRKSKYNETKEYKIPFESCFEEYEKGTDKNDDPYMIVDKIKKNTKDYFYLDYNKLQFKKILKVEINIIKLIKLTENCIIIIAQEINTQSWGYSKKYEDDVDFKIIVFNIILLDIKTGKTHSLYKRNILSEFLRPKEDVLKTFIHSCDAYLVNDNYIYFNLCFHREDSREYIIEFKNDLVICDINKKYFVKHNLLFIDLDELNLESFTNILSYKMKTNFYLIFGTDLYEFNVTKNGIKKSFISSFDEYENKYEDDIVVRFFKFKDNNFYIIIKNYLYVFRLKK